MVFTKDMRDMIEDQLPFLATTSKAGLPQIGPEGTLRVLKDGQLVYYEHTFRHAYRNMKETGLAAVAVANRTVESGFRFEGSAEIHEGDPLAEEVLAPTTIRERFPRVVVVVINVERIYRLNNDLDAGTRLF
ncbi:MAG: pyridoxamine 5'-phosphate oxidase family protein [Lentilactobacillus diolivorans]|jgi:predicted pyridoxine 5'-phosphate oxidase superfamily flavin-nucleotide-binding protein|nr:pyridoxamine 5'-phosphate oxidase family protein [Lentilactobacillus diolivorans]